MENVDKMSKTDYLETRYPYYRDGNYLHCPNCQKAFELEYPPEIKDKNYNAKCPYCKRDIIIYVRISINMWAGQ